MKRWLEARAIGFHQVYLLACFPNFGVKDELVESKPTRKAYTHGYLNFPRGISQWPRLELSVLYRCVSSDGVTRGNVISLLGLSTAGAFSPRNPYGKRGIAESSPCPVLQGRKLDLGSVDNACSCLLLDFSTAPSSLHFCFLSSCMWS